MSRKLFSELKVWKQKALYMSMYLDMNSIEIGKALGVSDRTVRDNLQKLQYNKDIVYDPDTGSRAKILYYDIETTLAISYHWGVWKQNLSARQREIPSHLLSHAWAWNDGEVSGTVLTPEEVLAHDPSRLVHEAWDLLDKCDVLVAHNGKNFDVKMLNAYFLSYGLPPPSPYKVIDTLHMAKRKFRLEFNSLDFIAKYLQVTNKIVNGGIDLWIGCAKGDHDSLRLMLEYNFGDIVTLRDVYKKLVAWDNDGVNMSLYNHSDTCPHCASRKIKILKDKKAYTVARKYLAYRCQDCEAILRKSGDKYYRVL